MPGIPLGRLGRLWETLVQAEDSLQSLPDIGLTMQPQNLPALG